MQSLTFASKTSTASQLKKKCAQNADRFHNLESTLQYFHIVEIKMLIFHYMERIVLNFLQNWKVNYLCLTTYEVNWRKKSTHNMESGKYSKKLPQFPDLIDLGGQGVPKIQKLYELLQQLSYPIQQLQVSFQKVFQTNPSILREITNRQLKKI